jgi:hypothetical protein
MFQLGMASGEEYWPIDVTSLQQAGTMVMGK